ncbi:ureidoglycolate hydrolase [Saccharata proteae CBS 121410]|uniref:Ureidoglycolate hydrolase n=1 Tax=Saccharata proteae CBS 121410 TaxID=1314787 RepID=A0A9P4HTQ7_9PEZI|nr:ureidoglycolate hydrolase [Saccharata proteae CBS 121410]
MTPSIKTPQLRIPVEPLTQASFAAFGTVVENPVRSGSESQHHGLQSVSANQGTALKYLDVTQMTNFYHLATSSKPAKAVMNMFVCSPRKLRTQDRTPTSATPSANRSTKQLFDVRILERHPFTSQTFIPMGLSPSDASTEYLVVVAPTLPTTSPKQAVDRPFPYPRPEPRRKRSITDIFSRARPSPFTNEAAPPPASATRNIDGQQPKGSGMPDVDGIKAFVAKGHQAVTYGAGTWHAPMVVLGTGDVDFVVVQFANGVGAEDCQEVELQAVGGDDEGISVVLDERVQGKPVRAKL